MVSFILLQDSEMCNLINCLVSLETLPLHGSKRFLVWLWKQGGRVTMTILDIINPSRLTHAFLNLSNSNLNCVTVQCTLCSYGSPQSLVSAPRQVHLLKHIVKYHWTWWLSWDWDGEVPPARYRDWRRSKFYKKFFDRNGELLSSDSEDNLRDIWTHCDPHTCEGSVHALTGGIATPFDMYEEKANSK